jgi:hypothetical protein
MSVEGSTPIPPLFWLTRPGRQEFAVHVMQDGRRLFPFFSSEVRALEYQQAHGLGHDWTVWGNETMPNAYSRF